MSGNPQPSNSPNPYQPGQPTFSSGNQPPKSVKDRVFMAGLAMLIVGVLGGLLALGYTILNIFTLASGLGGQVVPDNMNDAEQTGFWIGLIGVHVAMFGNVIANFFIAYAGYCMMSVRSYGVSMTGAILCLVPLTSACCLLGIPFGIWSLIVLNGEGVSQAFAASKSGASGTLPRKF